jgi:hypothetical protein
MDHGYNTIEFYSGDISGNFANAASSAGKRRVAGQRLSPRSHLSAPNRTCTMAVGIGGDGFYSRIDPLGTGSSLRFFQVTTAVDEPLRESTAL